LRLTVVSPFVDRRHGTERALAEVLERLARDYHCEIHLYAQRVDDLAVAPQTAREPRESGAIFWHQVPSVAGPHLLQFACWILLNSFCRGWDRRVHGISCDLVLSPGINCLDANVVLVHAIFHRLRELAKEEERESAGSSWFRRFHRRTYYTFLTGLEGRVYRSSRVALASVSSRTAGQLEKYFGRNDARVIPNGVDAAQFSPSARLARRGKARATHHFRDEDFVLLLIGNDWHNKGLPTILEALAKLSDAPMRLLVVGNDDTAESHEMAERLGIFERCVWEQSCTDILDAYAAADVYVSPSSEDSFGMPVAEAMACGLPVITSAFAGISSLLHDGMDSFVLRDPRDAESLAKLIRMLCEQGELRSRMGKTAAKAALEWTWERNAAAVWEFLQEVSARKHSS
jgi:UDP-glucose:(heptosyl)LPS alpha-1,3-glucosyltransferase